MPDFPVLHLELHKTSSYHSILDRCNVDVTARPRRCLGFLQSSQGGEQRPKRKALALKNPYQKGTLCTDRNRVDRDNLKTWPFSDLYFIPLKSVVIILLGRLHNHTVCKTTVKLPCVNMAPPTSFLTSERLNRLLSSIPSFPDPSERLAGYGFWVSALFMSGGTHMISLWGDKMVETWTFRCVSDSGWPIGKHLGSTGYFAF